MSDSGKSARPRQLTMAGWFVVGGSVFLMLSVFDTMTSLNSVDTREGVVQWLDSPVGEWLGLNVTEALSLWRVGLTVLGACAAAAAVLGFYALQGNRGARLALSVLAVPLLFTGVLTDGLIGALVAVATVMLWSGQARDWFAGRPVRELDRPDRTERKSGPWETTMPPSADRNRPPEKHADPVPPTDTPPAPTDTPPASSLSTATSSTAPGAMSGFGQQPAEPVTDPRGTAWMPPAGAQPFAPGAARAPAPPMVKVACIVTWVFAGMVALLYAGMLVVLLAAEDEIVDAVVETPAWERANLDQDMLVPVLWIGALMFLGWAVVACLLAWFTWRRHNWARWSLTACAAGVVVVGFLAFPVGLVHQLAAVATIVGLFGGAARAWFADNTGNQGPPPPGYQPGPHPGPQPGQYPYPYGPPQPGPPQPGPPQPGPPQSGPPQPGPPQSGPPQSGAPQGPPQGQAPPPGGKPPVW